jgi:hypothetical protein
MKIAIFVALPGCTIMATPVRSKSDNFWENNVKHKPFCLAPGHGFFLGLTWGTLLKSIQLVVSEWEKHGKTLGCAILHFKETPSLAQF